MPTQRERTVNSHFSAGEKAKEQKEKSERDSRNQELAGSSYAVPSSNELAGASDECEGLPWGSISMRHVLSRGQQQSSGHGGSGGSHNSQRRSGRGGEEDDGSGGYYYDYPAAGDDAEDDIYGQYSSGGYSNDAYPAVTSSSYSYQSFTSYDDGSGTGGGDFFYDEL